MTGLLSQVSRLLRIIAARWGVYVLMVAGLALAYCAAIAIGLYVQDDLTYDNFIPDASRVYLVSSKYGPAGRPLIDSDRTPAGVQRWIKSDLPQVDQVARLDTVEWPMRTARRQVKERFYWADANIFQVLKLPAWRGDLATALNMPGSLVMTRRMAVAYFGRADAIGQEVTTYSGIRLRVTAILADLPSNTHLDREIFAAGSSPYSKLSAYDGNWDLLWPNSYTYVTLKSGTDPSTLPARLGEISRRHWQGPNNLPDGFALIPLTRLHFMPRGDGELKPRGHLDSDLALTVVAAAILALACINFSGLVLAERNERTHEMALLSALGARRVDLITLVLRESLVVNGISALLGLVAIERLLPWLNSILDIRLELWNHPLHVVMVTIAAVVLALAGGIVPALVVSKTDSNSQPDVSTANVSSLKWRGWVGAQLTLVIVLLIATHTMSRQWGYATHDALNFDGGNVVMIRIADDPAINDRFVNDVRSVPGVQAVAQSWGLPTNDFVRPAWIKKPGTPMVSLTRNSVHPDFLKVYGVPLIAGRNLSGTFLEPETPREILINLAAVHALGFRYPAAALGQQIDYETDHTRMRSRIVGVIPDLRIATVYEPNQPMIFDNFSKYFSQINVRLAPQGAAETLRAIDAVWQRDAAGTVPIERRTFNDYLMQQYRDLHQQILVFGVVSAVAIMVSMLGLTGLSIFLTRHQMRELAIRKALGATFADLFLQRLLPFFMPLAVTNLVAWPLAWLCLRPWLGSFDEHVGLSPLSFVGAGLIAAAVSLLTLSLNAALTARDFSVSSSLRHH